MSHWGEFVSPDAHSASSPEAAANYAQNDDEPKSELFSKAQIDEIERLLDRIGANSSVDDYFLDEVHDGAKMRPAASLPCKKKHGQPAPERSQRRKNAISTERERLWEARIKDVQTYLESKKSNTTRAIMQERQYRKQVHQSKPWRRVHRADSMQSFAHPQKDPLSEYLIQPTDLRTFIESRSV